MTTTEDLFGKQPANPEDAETPTPEVEDKEPQGKEFYTPEEMRGLDPDNVDTSRIPEEMLPFYKSMLAPITKKSQQLSEALKKAEKRDEPREKPKTVLEHYKQDPEGTVGLINDEIKRLKSEIRKARRDSDFDQLETLEDEYDRWRDTREELIREDNKNLQKAFNTERNIQRALQSIPNYEEKRQAIVNFLMERGFDEDEANDIADISKGKTSQKVAKLLIDVVDAQNADQTIAQKQVKEKPSPLGRPGSSDLKKDDEFNYQEEFEKAKKSGDWSAILRYKKAI